MEIRHHPEDEMLVAYAACQLEVGTRLVVHSHLELCATCRERVRLLGAVGGALLEDVQPEPLAQDALARTLARIRQAEAPRSTAPPARRVQGPPPLPQDAKWPRALRDCTATRWKWIAPGMRWSRVSVPAAPEANVFLLRMADFEEMNRAYVEGMGDHRPARTVIGVSELPKPGVLLTMNLTAVTRNKR